MLTNCRSVRFKIVYNSKNLPLAGFVNISKLGYFFILGKCIPEMKSLAPSNYSETSLCQAALKSKKSGVLNFSDNFAFD
jgi:hypothetical protein